MIHIVCFILLGADVVKELLVSLLVIHSQIALAASPDEPPILVRVLVSGADPNLGRIVGHLYANEKDYLKTPAEEKAVDVNSEGSGVLLFEVTKQTPVGVMVFHDKNLNGRLDRSFIGIPKEPTATSNNARGRFGPPKWMDVRFDLNETTTEIEIVLSDVRRRE